MVVDVLEQGVGGLEFRFDITELVYSLTRMQLKPVENKGKEWVS